jgi:hypothetical protein
MACVKSCDILASLTKILSSQLGEYKYPNGLVIPAAALSKTPDEVEVIGIELIVDNTPIKMVNQWNQGVSCVEFKHAFRLYLHPYPLEYLPPHSYKATLEKSAEILMARVPRLRLTFLSKVDDTWDMDRIDCMWCYNQAIGTGVPENPEDMM